MPKGQSKQKPNVETLGFQAEVGRLLDIVTHALYSEREIFLRELISNAADACDRLRYEGIAKPDLMEGGSDFAITLSLDKEARTITVRDNGIGMSREDLVQNLGTIAKSGTGAFLDNLTGDARRDINLIGQFGVGFYSSFMVADKVMVDSRRAGENKSWLWTSDGQGTFTLEKGARRTCGTTITLHLKKDAEEFLEETRLRHIVKTWSNHIPFPVRLETTETTEDKKDKKGGSEQLNEAAALWTRPKSDITAEQYKDFYQHVSHGFDEPWATLHFRVEGVIEYTGLLFIPSMRPFDLFQPERMSKLKLHVRRVFITDECEELIPKWLRFLRGVVDSEDLPLNVSREMLQNNPVVGKIRSGLVKRVLSELEQKAEKEPEAYTSFWDNFGMVLKEGLYESSADRERLLKLARFHSTKGDGVVSLADYVANMKKGQEAIWYISGEDKEALARSPHLEGFAAKGVEVLYMTDPVDEFWLPTIGEFDGKPFKSVTRAGADLSSVKGDVDKEDEVDREKSKSVDGQKIGTLIAVLKTALGDAVKDVKSSGRLTSSAVCLVAEEGGMDMHLERMLKQHNQLTTTTPRILEINPDHTLIKALADQAKAGADLHDAAFLLLDQARVLEGESLPDPAAFARRMASVMEKAMG